MALTARQHYDFNRQQELGLVSYREYEPYQTPGKNILPTPFPYYVTNVLPCDPLQPVEYGKHGGDFSDSYESGFSNQRNGHFNYALNGYGSNDVPQEMTFGLESNGVPKLKLRNSSGEKRVTFRDDGLHTSREPRTSQSNLLGRPTASNAWSQERGVTSADDMSVQYNVLPHHISKVFKLNPREVPVQQYYDLTQLKRSNVRTNDQLLPRPQDVAFQDSMINKTFPAEHPYSSHTPRNAVFPKFAESPEDPKRGVDARQSLPKDPEMPSNPYDVIVVSKTKGHGLRRELQALPPESLKKPLEWPGDMGFDQKVKTRGGVQQYYPTPPKTLVPNLEKRPPSQQIAPKTANCLRNIERGQWATTYDLNHTGLGPSNPLALDNFDKKVEKLNRTGELDDDLYPRSIRTFDPPRPVEGRIARQLVPPPPPQVIREDNSASTTPRKMTHREMEEDRLLNGREYLNLPEGAEVPGNKHENEQWRRMGEAFHSDTRVQALGETKAGASPPDTNPMKLVGAPPEKGKSYLDELKDDQKETFQQVEASNRWKLLESGTPNRDVETLNNKYKILNDKEKPKVFYEHEGKYNEERAGLYKTSYIPERLTNSMTEFETSGPEIMNTMNSHVDAINYPTRLNAQMDAALADSKYIQSSRNGLYISGRLSPTEVLEPYNRQVAQQRGHLQQSPRTARVNVVENKELMNLESEHGRNYNQPKYLQEDEIDPNARQEPLMVMSHENQNLGNVRPHGAPRRGGKTVQFADNVLVATGAGAEPIRISSAPMELSVPNLGVNVADTQYQSTEAQYDWRNSSLVQPSGDQGQRYMDDVKKNAFSFASGKDDGKKTVTFGMSAKRRGNYDENQDQFASNSTTFFPGKVLDGASEQFKTAYQAQFPHYNIDYKNDPRFTWNPAGDTQRPQTCLLKIQDSFTKSNAHKKLHQVFPETNVDLRENITDGRQHQFDKFGNLNAQQLRGHCT